MIVVGGAIGWVVAQRVQMTQMPQLLATMQSLVGLAAVFIGFNTHIELVGASEMDEGARALLDRFAAVIAHLLNAGAAIIVVGALGGLPAVRQHHGAEAGGAAEDSPTRAEGIERAVIAQQHPKSGWTSQTEVRP